MIETEKGPGLENMLTSICRVVFYAIGVIFDENSRKVAKPLSKVGLLLQMVLLHAKLADMCRKTKYLDVTSDILKY